MAQGCVDCDASCWSVRAVSMRLRRCLQTIARAPKQFIVSTNKACECNAKSRREEKAKARTPHARLPGSAARATACDMLRASTGCSRPRPALATLGRAVPKPATALPQTTRPNMARSALSCRPRSAWRCLAWHPAQANRSAPAVGWPQSGPGDPGARRAAVTKNQTAGRMMLLHLLPAYRQPRWPYANALACAFARSWKGAET